MAAAPPSPSQSPSPSLSPLLRVAEGVAAPAPSGHSTGRVAAVGGAGVLVGVFGSMIALVAALIIGARRAASAASSVARRMHKAEMTTDE